MTTSGCVVSIYLFLPPPSFSLRRHAYARKSERTAIRKRMHLSDQGLIVILVVGLIAGWLAGKVVRGNGFRSCRGRGDWRRRRTNTASCLRRARFRIAIPSLSCVRSSALWLVRTGVSNGAIGCVRQRAHDNTWQAASSSKLISYAAWPGWARSGFVGPSRGSACSELPLFGWGTDTPWRAKSDAL